MDQDRNAPMDFRSNADFEVQLFHCKGFFVAIL
jgi:hypothetical protein